MKLNVSRDVLFEGLQRVFSVVPQKPTLPVLANFLLKAEDGKLYISGTDMDMSITTWLDCSIEEAGSLTVNAKRFLSIIRELPGGDIHISVRDEKVSVDYERGQSSISGMPATDYPTLKDAIEGENILISGDELARMVSLTDFAVATERTRISLTGVYWKAAPEGMVMVATDGHRLSLFEKGTLEDSGREAIVPPKALNQATKFISGGMELKRVVFGTGAILFDFGDARVFSKLIEGPYPNFRQVIPKNNSKKVFAATRELESSVRRASVLSSSITHQVRFSVTGSELEVSTVNADIGGEAREVLGVKYEGDPLMIGFNAEFFLNILRQIESEEIVMEMESPTSACVVKPIEKRENEETVYLIMPLRLSD